MPTLPHLRFAVLLRDGPKTVWLRRLRPAFFRHRRRRESRLRKVYHIEVSQQDRQNLVAANMVIRSVTGKMFNAEPVSEII